MLIIKKSSQQPKKHINNDHHFGKSQILKATGLVPNQPPEVTIPEILSTRKYFDSP